MKKVLLIGLDGATWDLIMPWIKEGKLPTLRSLVVKGVYGELESTIPPNTIPAWNSLATGKNPGKLGYFSWLTKREGSYEFEPKFLYSRERTIWDILSHTGKKVMILNVPNVHKVAEINGCVVAGWLYFGQQDMSYPKDLKKRLDDITGGYEVDPIEGELDIYRRRLSKTSIEDVYRLDKYRRNRRLNVTRRVLAMKNSQYLEKVYRVMDKHFKAFEFLLKERWDFAFIVFVATDRTQHRFWADKKVLSECYERVDVRLGKILDIVDKNTTVIVVSDHGFGPKKRVFYLNEWLLKNGYLHLKASVPKRVKVMKLVRKIGNSKLLQPLARLLHAHARKLTLSLVENTVFRVTPEKIDWKKTKAFASPAKAVGEIYLNVRGREREGIISPEKYEETRNEIRQKLMNLMNPKTGEKNSARVYNREEVYHGKYLGRAPDLVILQDDSINAFDTLLGQGQILSETTGEVGHHRINGIFIASGPNVKKGKKIKGARIYDIAPTILHIFGITPDNMDGRVLKEIFETEIRTSSEEGIMKYSPLEKIEAPTVYDSEDEKRILDRLRSLGYM